MARRIFNTSSRAETILGYFKDMAESRKMSAFISDAITSYILPQYGTLHTEALYLLDTISNELQDWKGPGGARIVPEVPEAVACTAVRRAVSWLRGNHLKNDSAIKAILSHYDTSGGKAYTFDDQGMISRVAAYAFKLGLSARDTTEAPDVDLGALVKAIVSAWNSVWDDPDAYEILIRYIYLAEPSVPFDPFEAIEIMRMMEQTFILEKMSD